MKTEYLFKMFLEFSKAYGINDTFNNFERYQDLFARGYMKKKKHQNVMSNYLII